MIPPTLVFHLDTQRRLKDRMVSRIFKPLFARLLRLGITPTTLSFIGFGFHVLSAYFFLTHYALFVISFLTFLLFDALDGTFARSEGLASDRGGHIDRLLDGAGALLFYLKAYFFLPKTLVIAAGTLFILNYVAMYAFRLEKKIGIFRWLCFAGLVRLYIPGLYLDIAYFTVFCPLRIAYHKLKKKSA